MTRLMHYTGWIKAFETVVIPENDVFFSRFLEATKKDQALERLKQRVERVVWNVQRAEWDAEWWEGGEKLLMGMSGLPQEDGAESLESSEDGKADSGVVSVRANKHA